MSVGLSDVTFDARTRTLTTQYVDGQMGDVNFTNITAPTSTITAMNTDSITYSGGLDHMYLRLIQPERTGSLYVNGFNSGGINDHYTIVDGSTPTLDPAHDYNIMPPKGLWTCNIFIQRSQPSLYSYELQATFAIRNSSASILQVGKANVGFGGISATLAASLSLTHYFSGTDYLTSYYKDELDPNSVVDVVMYINLTKITG